MKRLLLLFLGSMFYYTYDTRNIYSAFIMCVLYNVNFLN